MSRKELMQAIVGIKHKKDKDIARQLKEIASRAGKVLKKYKTLDLFYEHSYSVHTPLEATIDAASLPAFQSLIRLGADPFFKPKPDMPSAADLLAKNYFERFSSKETAPLFEWLTTDKESPLFTWNKLTSHEPLFEKFKQANLIPQKQYVNELPIHVAIAAGRMDLVQEVLYAAGNVQKAGDIRHLSILRPAIHAVLKGQKNSLEILEYLLRLGASPKTLDSNSAPAIIQAITAGIFIENVKEEAILAVLDLLFQHGASHYATNTNGYTPLMLAMMNGYPKLFANFLDKADAKTLNHQAQIKPNYLLFQLFDRSENRLWQLDILKLLPKLKEKGLEFNKTINGHPLVAPFKESSYSIGEVYAQNMSVLHFYVENMAQAIDDPVLSMNKHLAIIQALVANGADPKVKATFTQTKEEREASSYRTKQVCSSIELTAAEYARKIVDKIFNHHSLGYDTYLLKMYKEENDFLKNITYRNKEEQIRLHKAFHQFRNLELVLSGEKPIPYSGLPDIGKIGRVALKKESPPVVVPESGEAKSAMETNHFDPIQFEADLTKARTEQQQDNWQALKKSLVTYTKEAGSLKDFLARVEQFKTPLQLHFDITTNDKGEIIRGSMIYRFFHIFDPHKFPTSWETLRKFGQDPYGVDINTPYDQAIELQLTI